MIKEIDEKIDPFKNLTDAGMLQPIGEPQHRKEKEPEVVVNLGSENYPYYGTNEEKAVIEQFKEEYPRKKAVHMGKRTKLFEEWKRNNVIG